MIQIIFPAVSGWISQVQASIHISWPKPADATPLHRITDIGTLSGKKCRLETPGT